MQVDPARVEQIFSETLDKPSPAARAEFLAQACGQDAQLRQQVEALLAAHDAAENFLKLPDADQTMDPFVTLSEGAGSTIDRYKLLQQIGEGGFGVVFMAEQEQPVRRLVALKIIKLGMDTRQVVARFEAERQALAMMDHPGVAKVLDGGATATGRPYFVMELVKGTPITEYCNKNNLSIPKRLELFAQVCQAVQHAHQKGLIHRDIKPSNVLVATADDRPMAKVIDFGIAKAMQSRLTEKTLFTEFRQLIGTPEYMSPEQAEGGLDIDTRSDVYSLGVLLYELLAGSPPFDPKELRSKAFDEMKRIIREVEPPTPSTRLSGLTDTLPSIAAQRNIEPRKLAALVRGELDWIVMRCLEKDRKRRYQTANDLAQDVGRYLTDQPVEARPVSRSYRLKKFIRRNKAGVLAGSAIIAALLIGLTVASVGFIEARRQARIARTEAARSEQVAYFLKDMLKAVGPRVALGRDTTLLREILDKTAERVGKELKDQPLVEAELRATIGQVYMAISQNQKAEAMLRQALAMRRKLLGSEHLDVAASLNDLAGVLKYQGTAAEAESLLREALAIQRKLVGNEHEAVARSLDNLARTVRDQDRLAEAETLHRQALAMRKKLLGDDDPAVANSLNNLGRVLNFEGSYVEAEGVIREALATYRKLYGEEHPDVAYAYSTLMEALVGQGKLADAEAVGRQMLPMRRRLFGEEHQAFDEALARLAKILQREGKLDEAEALQREELAIERKLVGDEHPFVANSLIELSGVLIDRGKQAEAEAALREARLILKKGAGNDDPKVASSLALLRRVLADQGKLAEAEAVDREVIAIRKKTLGSEDPQVASALAWLVNVLADQGKLAEAEAVAREVLAIRKKLAGNKDPELANSVGWLARLLREQGKLAEAETICREQLPIQRALLGDEHPVLAALLSQLTMTLLAQKKFTEAEPLARQCLAIREKRIPDDWQTFNARSLVGASLLGQEKYVEAEPLLLAGYEGMKQREAKITPFNKMYLKVALERLAQLYEATNRPGQAGQCRQTLDTLFKSRPTTIPTTSSPASRP